MNIVEFYQYSKKKKACTVIIDYQKQNHVLLSYYRVIQNLYAPLVRSYVQMISLSILYEIEARKKLHLLVLNNMCRKDLLMSNLEIIRNLIHLLM